MTDHGWDPDHHDGDHHAGHQADDAVFHDEPVHDYEPYDEYIVHHHDISDTPLAHDDTVDVHESAVVHDPLPDEVHEAHDDFPAAVDIGALPEPVDGFPWIDTGSLGVVDPASMPAAPVDPVDPHELAEYAGTQLPPGADPWATLADSEDPATAALARWWSENQQ
jgi:hypothetical protein